MSVDVRHKEQLETAVKCTDKLVKVIVVSVVRKELCHCELKASELAVVVVESWIDDVF